MAGLHDKTIHLQVLPSTGVIQLQVMTKTVTTENGTFEVTSIKERDKPEFLIHNGIGVLVRRAKGQSAYGNKMVLVSKRRWCLDLLKAQHESPDPLSPVCFAVNVYFAALMSLSTKQLAEL